MSAGKNSFLGKRGKKNRLQFLFWMVLVLCVGCSRGEMTADGTGTQAVTDAEETADAGGTSGTDAAGQAAAAVLSGTDEDSDVTATITIDKAEYAAGETVSYTITIANNKKNYYTAKAVLEYTNSDGLIEAYDGSMPTQIVKLNDGEETTLTGAVVGDATVFGTACGNETADVSVIGMASTCEGADGGSEATAGKSNGILGTLAGCLQQFTSRVKALMTFSPVRAEAADYLELKLRPYVKFTYAGQEVTLRTVIELHAYQQKVTIDKSLKDVPTSITCHDPSIFKDSDGTYYILGTHITGGYTTDLRNWTSVDTSFRASFSTDTIKKIREWNKDSGTWYGYLWAPDVIYNPTMGKYCYYLSADGDDWKSNIVLLTSDSVLGPYEYAGSVVYGGFDESNFTETDLDEALGVTELPQRYITKGIANRKWGDKWPNCIDPCVFYDDDGHLWMSYGSWSGGIFMLELDEETGLRDYSVTYAENDYSDPYFGTKIAGGWYVSGEGSYIQKIGNYYWLFMSYGNLEAAGGYNVRVFRSERPDGGYEDMLGNSALYDKYVFNYNQSVGVRLFGGYKWRTFTTGQAAQGHNSAFVDDDGRAYIVYHSRTTDGTEGHTVKVHQLFLNEDEWLVAAPYITDGETLDASAVSAADIAGEYDIILHKLDIDYKNLEVNMAQFITLSEDGTVTGDYTGTWELKDGTAYISLSINGDTYKGVVLRQNIENSKVETIVFTAVGEKTQITLWGSKSIAVE